MRRFAPKTVVSLTIAWVVVISTLDYVIRDIRLLPIMLIAPTIALATITTPRKVAYFTIVVIGIDSILGETLSDIATMRQLTTYVVVILIALLTMWIASLRIQLEDDLRLARYEANRDSLTGLRNRRSIDQIANELSPLDAGLTCVAMVDIDNFKKVNDEYGHEVGDEVITEFGRRLASTVRSIDVVGRYGGEEFLLLIRGPLDVAREVTDRIVSSLRAEPIPTSAGLLQIRASIGVAEFGVQGLVYAIQVADRALYSAKNHGRDRIEVSLSYE